MRRTPAILVIVALLAAPVALLARGLINDTCECGCMCCKVAIHFSTPQARALALRRIAAGLCPYCGMKLAHHSTDYGFIAPIAPTAPVPVATVPSPAVAREIPAAFTPSPIAGFFPEPFEPPRA